jgi:hypothetical protein
MPIDPHAVNAANAKLWRDHPKLKGRQLTDGPEDAAYRKEWRKNYQAAKKKSPTPPAPKVEPQAVISMPPALITASPTAGCSNKIADLTHLQKIEKAFELALPKIPAEIRKDLPDPASFAAMMAGIGALFLVANFATGGLATAAVVLLGAITVAGAFLTGVEIGKGIKSLMSFWEKTRCDRAKTIEDLDKASQDFANVVGQIGAAMIMAILSAAAGKAAKIARQSKRARKLAAKLGGILSKHLDKISKVAKKNDQIILFQKVNPKAAEHLENGAATKGMDVKAKTDKTGLIPMDQSNNPKALEVEAKKPGWIAEQNADLKGKVKQPGEANPGDYVEMDDPSGLRNSDGSTKKVLGKVNDQGETVVVTSDLDTLAIGSKKSPGPPIDHPTQGTITPEQQETLADINSSVDHPGGNVVQHGPANMVEGQRPSYPVTAIEPDGNVKIINNDAELKSYFNEQNAEGYNLHPHESWGWEADENGNY